MMRGDGYTYHLCILAFGYSGSISVHVEEVLDEALAYWLLDTREAFLSHVEEILDEAPGGAYILV